MKNDGLAFDRASVRSFDPDGRLHVEIANISKSNVCPYLGSEVPGGDALGLDPAKVYQLLRDPEELAKAASTFNNLPLLSRHAMATANDPMPDLVIGSTGTDATFSEPFLTNSLVIWDADAVKGVESGEQREISCGYRYEPDMTPGTYEGVQYDGVMRNIHGSHVALVPQGRAGSDVVVGDSIPPEIQIMKKQLSRKAALAKGALIALKPKLAADAKLDLNPILAGITSANWLVSKPLIAAAIKPKLANDADLSDIVELLDSLDGQEPDDDNVGLDDDPTDAPADVAADASPVDDILAMLKGKISDDDLAAVEEKLRGLKLAADDDKPADAPAEKPADAPADKPAQDNPPPTPGTPAPPATASKKDDAVDKPAMDAAIKAAVTIARAQATKDALRVAREISTAENEVRPYVGELKIAADSADEVYKAALELLGKDVSGIHPSAYRALLDAQPKASAARPRVAMDSAAIKSFAERFPQASKVRNLG